MRRLPWRTVQPQDLAADQAKLQARLDNLTEPKPASEDAVAVPSSAPAEPAVLEAAISPAPAEPVVTAPPTSLVPAEPVVIATSTSLVLTQPVLNATPIGLAPGLRDERDRRRRRRFGFLLFFAALIFVFFVVRAIPADWEIGPFRIDASGSAADSAASIYFSDDPHAPFWLLVPTFNLPPRFFAARLSTLSWMAASRFGSPSSLESFAF